MSNPLPEQSVAVRGDLPNGSTAAANRYHDVPWQGDTRTKQQEQTPVDLPNLGCRHPVFSARPAGVPGRGEVRQDRQGLVPTAAATSRIAPSVSAPSAERALLLVTATTTVMSSSGQCRASVPQNPPCP